MLVLGAACAAAVALMFAFTGARCCWSSPNSDADAYRDADADSDAGPSSDQGGTPLGSGEMFDAIAKRCDMLITLSSCRCDMSIISSSLHHVDLVMVLIMFQIRYDQHGAFAGDAPHVAHANG